MSRSIAVLGFAALLQAACSSGPFDEQHAAGRDEAYIPIGSNIARREPRPAQPAKRVGGSEASAPATARTP